ncbi:hypothetical protein GPECTOR_35g849 [Gonium pectorale]|uniref:Uncharacterized protein n=1 Tax=Gonium pectorale TaxID=33097 RepID=A0A150GC29_GONPE|nr:hypothetical protein GPECTOR_35g849 [Gonium pectorale]|eukprot:KXZ47411.1 hypothetical protein GPECTOR_35g849 [Gonium pectorale]
MSEVYAEYPAGVRSSQPPSSVSKLPNEVTPEVQQLIQTIRDYKSATEWERIDEATRALDTDCVYDSPFMYITGGRDRVRAVAKLLAPFAHTEFEPKLVRILMDSASRKAEMEVDGTLRVVPHRYWFLPATWFIPTLPIEGTVSMHVKSWNDKVARVEERFFNLPTIIPLPFRWVAGWLTSTAGILMEPALRTLSDWTATGRGMVEGGTEAAVRHPAVATVVGKAEELKESVAGTVGAAKAKVVGLVSE